ncbi:hypothetical protein AO442_002907, partial [Nakaseomyces glabratus]
MSLITIFAFLIKATLVLSLDILTPTTLTGDQTFNEDVSVVSSLTLNDGSQYLFNNLLQIAPSSASVTANALAAVSVFTFSLPPSSSLSNSGTLIISNSNTGPSTEQHIVITPNVMANTGTITLSLAHTNTDSSSTLIIDPVTFYNTGTINYESIGSETNDPSLTGNILSIGSSGRTLQNLGTINLNAANSYYLLGTITENSGSINVQKGFLYVNALDFIGNTINLSTTTALAFISPVSQVVRVRGVFFGNIIASVGSSGTFSYNTQTGILTVTTNGVYSYDIGC